MGKLVDADAIRIHAVHRRLRENDRRNPLLGNFLSWMKDVFSNYLFI